MPHQLVFEPCLPPWARKQLEPEPPLKINKAVPLFDATFDEVRPPPIDFKPKKRKPRPSKLTRDEITVRWKKALKALAVPLEDILLHSKTFFELNADTVPVHTLRKAEKSAKLLTSTLIKLQDMK